MRYLISGGGTGGHIFPAVSIANALKQLDPQAQILFVGALGRMEMERVPQAGYEIVGLPIRGFNRAQPWKNVSVIVDLIRSMRQAKRIIRTFRPDVGVGVGGYASGAAMKVAAKMGIPILLQEQNGFAGVTNKLLKDDAQKICVAYEHMDRFFPKEKLILTGNPVRQNLTEGQRVETGRKTLLIIGGSLGARTINEAIFAGLDKLQAANIDIVWQTGKLYYDKIIERLQDTGDRTATGCLQDGTTCLQVRGKDLACSEASTNHSPVAKRPISPSAEGGLEILPFLTDMPDRYAQADLVISRAGASSISELCLLGKPSILVPSPNVAEDHQTHNAMALVNKNAAVLVRDSEANDRLVDEALRLIVDDQRLEALHTNVLTLAQKDSATRIAQEVIKLAKHELS